MLRLPERLRKDLSKSYGKLYEGEGVVLIKKIDEIKKSRYLACIGDLVCYYTVKALVERSNIPNNFDELIKLPGVGRKVANIILAEVFGRDVIAVDTHVHRISNRLGVIKTRSPEETENELKKVIPKHLWRRINKAFVGFGQTVCLPKNPLCEECPINENCQYYKNRKLELNKPKYKKDENLKNNKKS